MLPLLLCELVLISDCANDDDEEMVVDEEFGLSWELTSVLALSVGEGELNEVSGAWWSPAALYCDDFIFFVWIACFDSFYWDRKWWRCHCYVVVIRKHKLTELRD